MESHLQSRRLTGLGRVLAALILGLAACAPPAEPPAQPGPLRTVASTIPPLHGLVRPLLPDRVNCRPIIAPGEAIHGHRTSPEEVAAARSADIVFAVGLGIDAGVLDPLVRDPDRRQSVTIFAEVVDQEAVQTHKHAPGEWHDEDHTGIDAHLWLDPVLAAQFVQQAATVLADRAAEGGDSALADDIRDRSEAWLERIDAIDAAYRERLAPYRGRTVLTTHPAFGRVLRRYGLEEVSFSPLSPHSAPSPAQLAAAVGLATDRRAAAIFTEPQAPLGPAQSVAERTGLPMGTLDPLGSGDWEAMMTGNLDELVHALSASLSDEAP